MPPRLILGLWLMALVPMLMTVDGSPVQRTQEARVLETARQMLGHGAHGWLLPALNGEIRVRKPPLAYWMAGAAFKLWGVSEAAGRLPTALLSWLTIGVTYSIAARRFDRMAGVFAAAALWSSYIFFRFGRLAETDAPAVFFATVATDLFWRAMDENKAGLFHLAAAATGLSFFAKQGPGAFPLLFFVAMSLIQRQPKAIGKFILCGAPITLLVVAGWWYVYAAADQGMQQFRSELREMVEGVDHPATFLIYFPWVMLATAPWSLVVVGAVIAAARRARGDARLMGMLVWAAADFVPLWFMGNKQLHYLLSLMPPLMMLVGWLLSEAVKRDADANLRAAVGRLMGITMIASVMAPLALPVAAAVVRKRVGPLDVGMEFGIGIASAWAWWMIKRRGLAAAALAFALVWAFSLAILLDVWGPAISPTDIRLSAAQISQRFGGGPFVFYGSDNSLPLCFALREEIDAVPESRPDQLLAEAAKTSGLVVICQFDDQGRLPKTPPGFVQVGPDYGAAGQHFRLFQLQ